MSEALLNHRRCATPIVAHPGNYDIAPVIVCANPSGPARIFWGGSNDPHAGDHIFSASAPHFWGPYTAPELQLAPWGTGQEKVHVDDPSVVLPSSGIFAGHWFLYYGGSGYRDNACDDCDGVTSIFVAWCRAGHGHWFRTNAHQPIISPRGATFRGSYGAGQPSVFFHDTDQKFYMLYTDTTGHCATEPGTGAILYLLRSNNYLFHGPSDSAGSVLEEYLSSSNLWVPLASTSDPDRTSEAYILDEKKHSATVDWALSLVGDGTEPRVVIASNDYNVNGLYADVYHRPLSNLATTTQQHTIQYDPAWLGGVTTKTLDGPGLVRKPNGTIYNEGLSEGRPFVSVDLTTSFWQASAWSFDKGWEDGQKFLTSEIFWSGADVWTGRNGAGR